MQNHLNFNLKIKVISVRSDSQKQQDISIKSTQQQQQDMQSYEDEKEENENDSKLKHQSIMTQSFTSEINKLQRKKTTNHLQKYDLKLINQELKAIDPKKNKDLETTCYFIETKMKNIIPVLYIQIEKSDYCLLHSHSNATDLGQMHDNYLDISQHLGVNIVAYDYAGYGQSTGQPSDISTISDIEAVYEFIIKELGFKWNQIILYGQSLGSGPSIALASNKKFPVIGLIIHSGLASIFRVLNPVIENTAYLDVYPNIDLLQYVNCLVYIFHGTNDQIIPIIAAQFCAQNVKNLYEFWIIEQGGHCNLEYDVRFRKEYFKKLNLFINEVKVHDQFFKPEELLKFYRADRLNSNFNHLYQKQRGIYSSSRSQTVTNANTSRCGENQGLGNNPSEISQLELVNNFPSDLDVSLLRKNQKNQDLFRYETQIYDNKHEQSNSIESQSAKQNNIFEEEKKQNY